jgi:DNA-binding MarR family transcriptional regulator
MPLSRQLERARNGLDDLPFYLARTAVAFRRVNDCALREAGLKSQPLGAGSVLHVLFEQKCCTVKSLAEQTDIPNGTLTGVLNGLEQEGFIRRVENAEDGRSWLIQLAPKGEAIRKKMKRRHEIIVRLFEKTLSPKETVVAKSALHRLTKAMNDYVGANRNRSIQKARKDSQPRDKSCASKKI